MSGRRQHFVPQFLQRGFASRRKGGASKCWVYMPDKAPFECSTRNIGVSRDFYSGPDDTAVDDLISDAEANMYSGIVKTLREAEDPSGIAPEEVYSLLAHFQTRSKNLRSSLSYVSHLMMKKLLTDFSDINHLREQTYQLLLKEPERVLSKLELPNHQFDPASQELIIAGLRTNIRNGNLDDMVYQLASFLKTKIPETQSMMEKGAALGQQKALSLGAAPTAIFKKLEMLDFSIERYLNLPLGDSMIVYEIAGTKKPSHRTFIYNKDEVRMVMLPISSTQALVGLANNVQFRADRMKRAVMECSSEFFIASELVEEYENGAKLIGSKLNIVGDEEFKNTLDSISVI